MYRAVLMLPAVFVLAGCLSSPVRPVPSAHYRCEGGADLQVQFPEGKAVVTFPDQTSIALPQQVSGSGFRYSDGRNELRGKGDTAIWDPENWPPTNCRAE